LLSSTMRRRFMNGRVPPSLRDRRDPSTTSRRDSSPMTRPQGGNYRAHALGNRAPVSRRDLPVDVTLHSSMSAAT
jgi:hypothetical protein